MPGESALTVRNAAMGFGTRGAASAAYVIENRFRQVGGEAPAAPIRAEIKSEMTDDEIIQITHVCSQKTYKNWTSLLKRRGFITVDMHACVAAVTPSLKWVGSKLRSGGHGPHAAWSEYSHLGTRFVHPLHIVYKQIHSPFWLWLCRRVKSSHPVSLAWSCVSCPAVHIWTVLWLHVCNMTLNKQKKTKATRPEIDADPDEEGGGGWRTIADSRFYPFATFKDWRIMVVFGGASMQKLHRPVKDVLIWERILHFLLIS